MSPEEESGELSPVGGEGYNTNDDYFEEDPSVLTHYGCSDLETGVSGSDFVAFPKLYFHQPYICPLCSEIPQHCTSTVCGHAFCTLGVICSSAKLDSKYSRKMP